MSDSFLLHHYLRDSAHRSPENIAVRSPGQTLTYSELDSLTDKVATKLREVGIRNGDRIGIYLPKSLSSIIAIYSAAKAGAIYVPFDPDSPAERLSLIARDCGIKAVMSCSPKFADLKSVIMGNSPVTTALLIDADTRDYSPAKPVVAESRYKVISWVDVLSTKGEYEQESQLENDTAYILYTSGSTGIPKGVMISHRNCMSFVDWATDYVRLKSEDVVACHSPIHFDISTFSIFGSCKAGASVFMVPEKAAVFPTQLAKLIEQEGITVWYSVPSVLTLLVLYGSLTSYDLSRLRAIVFAGEVFPTKYLRRLMSIVPNARYLNWFGPTETNVCTSYEVSKLDRADDKSIPIGRPIANTEVFVLNSDGKLVTQSGEKGLLYVKGPTVMQGYWGDAAKTAKRLVSNPLDPLKEEKVFATGDIVAKDGEGNYLYFGREDNMIKSRGYRIELGEIEAVMNAHPEVKEVAVVPVPDDLAGNRLHAFVSPPNGRSLAKDDLLSFCANRLPRYMIPDSLTILESLPRTANGKIDRVSLAADASHGGEKH